MNILVLDYECTVNNVGDDAIGTFPGTPWHPNNRTIVEGYSFNGDIWTYYRNDPTPGNDLLDLFGSSDLVVGFNIRYDLHFLRKQYPLFWKHLMDKGIKVWDCQYAEYLLSGQVIAYPNLDATALKYGGTLKDTQIKEFWDNGVKTEDIPKELLVEYNKQDVLNTELVFYGQLEKAEELGMLPVISSRMDSILATQEMEYNGLYVDKELLCVGLEELSKELGFLKHKLTVIGQSYLNDEYKFNPGSSSDISKLIYGGTYTVKRQVEQFDEFGEVLLYKSGDKKGLPKLKIQDFSYVTPGLGIVPKEDWNTAREGIYQVNEGVLSVIAAELPNESPAKEVIKELLNFRSRSKDYSTYYKGIYFSAWPGNILHGSINHCVTCTSRLSSSDPNLQNISNKGSDIKKYFRSRYDKGYIVEADLSQIEIVVQAYLTQDKQLMDDLTKGVDFHCKRVAEKEGLTYEGAYRLCRVEKDPIWAQKRQEAKEFSFQRAYGAGALGISTSTGISLDEVKKLIAAEERMYPEVVKVHKEWIKEVERNSKPSRNKSTTGLPLKVGYMRGPNGQRYVFNQSEWNGRATFKPTEIKNYVVQGTTADILCLWIGRLLKRLWNHRPNILMVNTVHDSVLFDIGSMDYLPLLVREIEETIRELPDIWEFHYKSKFNVPIKGTVKYGKNWKDQEEYR